MNDYYDEGVEICDNGNKCGKGKVTPCTNYAKHTILTVDKEGNVVEGGMSINLCEEHFDLAMRAGLITEPYLGYSYDS